MGDVVVDGLKGCADFTFFHGGAIGCGGFHEGLAKGEVFRFRGVGGGDRRRASALEKVDGAVEEVAEVVGELGVEEHDEAVEVEIAIAPGANVAAEVVAQGIDTKFVGKFVGIDNVTERLGHFIAFDVPESVDQEGGHVGCFEAHRVKHTGPVDGVGRDEDVFADDLKVGGPEFVKFGEVGALGLPISGEGDVVDEGVEPDVGHEVGIEGEGNAPGHPFLGAGDAEISVAGAFDGVEDFVSTELWQDFEVVGFDGGLEPLGVVGEFEIPVFLFAFFDVAPLRSEFTGFIAVAVGEVLFLTNGVESGVGFFVELALLFEIGEDGLNAGFMTIVGGFGPAVVADIEFLPESDEALGIAFGKSGDINAFFLGGFDHFLAMLVDAGEVIGLFTAETMITGQNVGEDLLEGVSDMRFTVGVVDGGGDEKHRENLGDEIYGVTKVLVASAGRATLL